MATAAAAPATGSSAPSAPPPPVPSECTHKNRLQQFTLKTYQKVPIYNTVKEGEHHQPKFTCTVQVGDEHFSSAGTHGRRKEAEQDAARVAFENLVKRKEDVLGLIDQGLVFCKSILLEFAVKTKTTAPEYSAVHPAGLVPMPLFAASVAFGGNTYFGEAATSKKEAEQKAARAAVKSILATNNDACMLQTIKSKERLITASTSSGHNKGGAVSQETINNPTKALPPVASINFVRAVGDAANGGPAHVAPASPAGSSSQILYNPVSKKARKNRTLGPQGTEGRVGE